MISLKNNTKHPESINLPHEDMCGKGDKEKCLCKQHEHRSLILDRRTGEVRTKIVTQSVCASVHLLPGVWSDPLPDDAASVTRVAELLNSNKLSKKVIESLPVVG